MFYAKAITFEHILLTNLFPKSIEITIFIDLQTIIMWNFL